MIDIRKVVFYFLGGLSTAVLLFILMALISWGLKGMHKQRIHFADVLVYMRAFNCIFFIACHKRE